MTMKADVADDDNIKFNPFTNTPGIIVEKQRT